MRRNLVNIPPVVKVAFRRILYILRNQRLEEGGGSRIVGSKGREGSVFFGVPRQRKH